MSFKAVIFDLDGVIVDSAKFHFLAWQKLAKKLGLNFTEADNERLKGVSRTDSLNIILEINNSSLPEAEKSKWLAYKNDLYLGLVAAMDENEILPGIASLIDELLAAGIKVALGSSSKNARLLLTRLGLIQKFDVIVDGTNISRSKPDPEVFLLGANLLKLAPKRCLVVEDAYSGVEAANTGGFLALGVGSPEALSNAEHVIPGFEKTGLAEIQEMFK